MNKFALLRFKKCAVQDHRAIMESARRRSPSFVALFSRLRGCKPCPPQPCNIQLLPVFVNKVVLECSHALWFTCCLQLLSCYNSRIQHLRQKVYGPQSKNVYYLAPYEKVCWPLPSLCHSSFRNMCLFSRSSAEKNDFFF